MRWIAVSLLLIATRASFAQESKPDRAALRTDLEPSLSFEAPVSGNMPGGWRNFSVSAGSVFTANHSKSGTFARTARTQETGQYIGSNDRPLTASLASKTLSEILDPSVVSTK